MMTMTIRRRRRSLLVVYERLAKAASVIRSEGCVDLIRLTTVLSEHVSIIVVITSPLSQSSSRS